MFSLGIFLIENEVIHVSIAAQRPLSNLLFVKKKLQSVTDMKHVFKSYVNNIWEMRAFQTNMRLNFGHIFLTIKASHQTCAA